MLGKNCQLAGLGDTVALFKKMETVIPHFFQQEVVDFPHDPGGHQRAAIRGGERFGGLVEKIFRPPGLVGHQRQEAVVPHTVNEVLLGVSKAGHVFQRQLDPPAVREILPDVALDIGQLQGVAERHRVALRSGIGAAENPDRNQPDRAGDLPDVLG